MSVLKPVNTRSGSTIDLVNRQTSCRFSGVEIQFNLSLGLFSSAGIDAGSMLLLKTIGKKIDLDSLSTILDVGCGVGTLGLALAKRCPKAEIQMVDRDELAVSFSRQNAELNAVCVNNSQLPGTDGRIDSGSCLADLCSSSIIKCPSAVTSGPFPRHIQWGTTELGPCWRNNVASPTHIVLSDYTAKARAGQMGMLAEQRLPSGGCVIDLSVT